MRLLSLQREGGGQTVEYRMFGVPLGNHCNVFNIIRLVVYCPLFETELNLISLTTYY